MIALILSSILLAVLILASPISPLFSEKVETSLTLFKSKSFVDGIAVTDSDENKVSQTGNILRITKSGVYRITGSLKDIQILVDVEDVDNTESENSVEIILDNVEVFVASMPAIVINEDADITLAEGSINKISSTADATIFSTSSIIFDGEGNGNGKLTINSERDGIKSDSDIIFENGQYEINAGGSGISADKGLVINGGSIVSCGMGNEAVNNRSDQHFMHLMFHPEKHSDSILRIIESQGKEILKYQVASEHNNLLFSSPELKANQRYAVYDGNILQQHSVNYTTDSKNMPRDLEDWLNKSDIPDDIRKWIITKSYGQASTDFLFDDLGATFYNVQDSESITNNTEWPFKDVSIKKWYYQGIKYSYEKGFMKGVSDSTFAPKKKITRAMLVTILHRIEGLPEPLGSNNFSDVARGKWYSDAVVWAEENDIVNGYNKSIFGPKDLVTREQLISILYRFAVYKGYDVSIDADIDISDFTDYNRIAKYARVPTRWAYAQELIDGRSENTMVPKIEATRAEVSVILMRFLKTEDL